MFVFLTLFLSPRIRLLHPWSVNHKADFIVSHEYYDQRVLVTCHIISKSFTTVTSSTIFSHYPQNLILS